MMDSQKDIELLNKNYFSVRREILYNILFEFRIDKKVVRRKKIVWQKRVGKNLCDMFPIKIVWKKMEMIYRHCF